MKNIFENDAQYMHFRLPAGADVNPRSGATFAYVEIPGENGEAPRVRYGKAVCSTADNFCRKVGKNIALHRLGSDERAREFVGTVKEFQAKIVAKQLDLYGLVRKYSKKSK